MTESSAPTVVLITDSGELCADTDPASLASNAVAGTPSVRTGVIYLPGAVIDADIASSGGTGAPYLPSASDMAAGIRDALLELTLLPRACTYPTSAALPAGVEDFGAVALSVEPAGGGRTTLPRVGSSLESPSNGGLAWYYADAGAPTSVSLCPEACSLLDTADFFFEAGCE